MNPENTGPAARAAPAERGHGNGTRDRGDRPGGGHRRGRNRLRRGGPRGGWRAHRAGRPGATVEGPIEPAAEDGKLRQREEQLARSAQRSESLERSLDRRTDELE